MFDKHKLMVSILVRTRDDYYKLFPMDATNYGKMTEVIHSLCWKIKDSENNITQKASQ